MKTPHYSRADLFGLLRFAAWVYVIQAATGFAVSFAVPWLRFFQLDTY
jgi:hypothetical protein